MTLEFTADVTAYYGRFEALRRSGGRALELTVLSGPFTGCRALKWEDTLLILQRCPGEDVPEKSVPASFGKSDSDTEIGIFREGSTDRRPKVPENVNGRPAEALLTEACERIKNGAVLLPGILKVSGEEIFAERPGLTERLVICGGGHVAQALTAMASMTGFEVTVIEDRPSFCSACEAAGAARSICGDFGQVLSELDDTDAPYFVVMTRGHRSDVACLRQILTQNRRYVGMMGSKSRTAGVAEGLIEDGYREDAVAAIHMPIGLSIGAQTPQEIAVSVLAELIQVRYRSGAAGSEDLLIRQRLARPQDSRRCALAEIVAKEGSGPRRPGTKMLVYEDGSILGTIGGGCAEAAIISQAVRCIRKGNCLRMRVNMTKEEAADRGMVCGGIIEAFITPL